VHFSLTDTKIGKNQLLNAVNNSNGDQIDYRPDGDVLTDS
jgi:hypothetical protein